MGLRRSTGRSLALLLFVDPELPGVPGPRGDGVTVARFTETGQLVTVNPEGEVRWFVP